MTTARRALVLAARSSPALYAVPCLFGLELGVVMLQGTSWTMEWRWALDWAGAGVFLAGPLAGGLAAWQSQAVRHATGEAAESTRESARAYAFHAGGVLVWATAAHALVVGVVLATGYREGLTGIPNLAPVLLHVMFLGACVAIGFLAGQLTNSRLLAPLLVVGLLFAVIQASNGTLPPLWVEVAGATAPLLGLAYRPGVVVAQVIALLAVVLVGAAVTRGVHRLWFSWRPLAAGLLALTLAAGWLSTTRPERFERAGAIDVAYDCYGESPQVCLIPGGSTSPASVQAVLAMLHTAAGPASRLPASYVQVLGAEVPGREGRALVLDSHIVAGGRPDPGALAHYLVWNRACLLSDQTPPADAIDLLSDLSAVLVARMDPGSATAEDRMVRSFRTMKRHRQDAWIAAALEASDRCAFDEVPDWLDQR